ncbi:GntR family transcriptional regulator [Brevibacillus humidisoli]|uniref:GntR family transcriptional regulator n=1 Tax=Brevibacillus humidisoli TaxID=2895522 RepID=UPI001E4A3780|nr:GntR family transcriptional regulator [Brevibacillus humidisoli]UFJ40893.1 GntR family transcriptional regulator [Brevibacillus humidisoli]
MGLNLTVSTQSIHTQVTNVLRNAIVSGEFALGEKLSETALAQRLGVSRTPVREALKQLQQEGLVEIIPRVGTCVRKPTEKEIFELFKIKESLEGLAAGLMAERGEIPESNQLVQAMESMEEAVEKRDIDRYVESNGRFHDAILRGSGNSKLLYHFNLLINQLPYKRFVYITLDQPDRLEKSINEHRRIVEAIQARDTELAEKLMREHVKASGDKLIQVMKAELYG